MAQEAPRRFGIKSGEFKTVTEMMGQKIESPSWFDNYGGLVASKASANGMEVSTIMRDGRSYLVDLTTKQLQEVPVQESINYLNLDEATVSKYKIKEIGKDLVAGKECIIYSLEVTQMGQTAKMTVSVWNGFPMKSATSSMGVELTTTITEIKECEVDSSVFEVPSNK